MSLPNHLRRAQQFAHRINRRISLRENHNDRGYYLTKPGVQDIGFVRFNTHGRNAGKYSVYAFFPFDDPRGLFQNNTKDKPNSAWWCTVNPNDEATTKYVVAVLESSYDQK